MTRPQHTRPAILALGSINADFQVRAERWPEPGETLMARDFIMLGGGKAANVAYFACRVGVPAILIARLGDDVLADVALKRLKGSGIDLSYLRRVRGAATGVAMISVRADGDKTILLAGNANDMWQACDAEDAASAVSSAPAGSVLVADLEIPSFVVERTAEAARARSIKVVLDPSPAERMTARLYQLADALTPNRSEARQLTGREIGHENAEEIAASLRKRGGGTVLLKLGGDCVLATAQTSERLRSMSIDPVDTTGAGDAFAAALAMGLLEGQDIRNAALLAMAASSIAIEAYGSQPAYPDRQQLEARLGELATRNT